MPICLTNKHINISIIVHCETTQLKAYQKIGHNSNLIIKACYACLCYILVKDCDTTCKQITQPIKIYALHFNAQFGNILQQN